MVDERLRKLNDALNEAGKAALEVSSDESLPKEILIAAQSMWQRIDALHNTFMDIAINEHGLESRDGESVA